MVKNKKKKFSYSRPNVEIVNLKYDDIIQTSTCYPRNEIGCPTNCPTKQH